MSSGLPKLVFLKQAGFFSWLWKKVKKLFKKVLQIVVKVIKKIIQVVTKALTTVFGRTIGGVLLEKS